MIIFKSTVLVSENIAILRSLAKISNFILFLLTIYHRYYILLYYSLISIIWSSASLFWNPNSMYGQFRMILQVQNVHDFLVCYRIRLNSNGSGSTTLDWREEAALIFVNVNTMSCGSINISMNPSPWGRGGLFLRYSMSINPCQKSPNLDF